MFILPTEYKALIQEQILDLTIEGDTALITQIEQAVVAEMTSYLNARYDCQKVFSLIETWNAFTGYAPGSAVINPIINNGVIYTATIQVAGDMPPPIWSNTESYAANTVVYYSDGTTSTGTYQNTSGGTLAGTPPLQPGWTRVADSWIPKDPRNPIVMLHFKNMVIYHLSMRINMRSSPEVRLQAYQRAIKWLEGVQAEKVNPELPKYTSVTFDTANDHRYILFGSQAYHNTRW